MYVQTVCMCIGVYIHVCIYRHIITSVLWGKAEEEKKRELCLLAPEVEVVIHVGGQVSHLKKQEMNNSSERN